MSNVLVVDISDYTNKKLKAHYQNNEEFNQELAISFEFYKNRFLPLVKEQDIERLERELLSSIKSQIYNGYFMAMEFLSHEDTQIEDSWFQQSHGMIAQQIPDLLRTITGNKLEDVITYEPMRKLSSWLVIDYGADYPSLMELSLNTACIGAKWALLDEGEKQGLNAYQAQYKGLLANLDDITFLDPETYITAVAMNPSVEIWEVIKSKHIQLDKIGEVTILSIKELENQSKMFVNVSLKNTFSPEEQETLLNNIVTRVMALNDVERENITLAAAMVDEFYYFTN
ncbi:hypothetical protein D1B31_17975 [Neobacillus notoginsengisoli]|uniref:Uncharacterized protein n=1 Tax=Neobacillus notoginsengisoli TaxID=1578198 RepID=A0A417YPR1_9BACI|nr:hypothetical protein [Neobacillus notoginsengisoli]RHW35977.1 hypothetical protein D1B31_17975 [Neobacillus notoginsengisoli]